VLSEARRALTDLYGSVIADRLRVMGGPAAPVVGPAILVIGVLLASYASWMRAPGVAT